MIGLLSVLLPAVGAPVARLEPIRSRAPLLLTAIGALNSAIALKLLLGRPANAAPAVLLDGFFVVDATSLLFLVLVNVLFLSIAAYVWSRVVAQTSLQEGIGRYAGFALAFIAASNLAVLSNHLIAMWVFLEGTTLAAVPLIQHRGDAASHEASWKYFLFSSVGLVLAFLGIACLGHGIEASGAGEPDFFFEGLARAALRPPDLWRRVGLALLFLGFGTKLGLAPMYSWLPETYDRAPPATTALLAAVQFNVALVPVVRVLQIFRVADDTMVSGELIALGLATMAVSALNMIGARNYKKLLAYASLNHAGVIAIGLGIGRGAAFGVVLYVVSNAFIKALLFLTAGKIESHYQTDEIGEVSGLIKDLPYSGLYFMVGTFALLGLPPFGSFLGELLILSGLVRSGYVGVFVGFCSVLAITFVATGRAMFPMIWAEPKRKVDWGAQPLLPALPQAALLCALVAMGLYLPAPVSALFRQVAAGLGGTP